MPDTRTQLTAEQRLQLMDVGQIAKLFHVHEQTIRGWCRIGRFPPPIVVGRKTYRWRASVVESFINDIDPGDFVGREGE